MCDDKYAYSGFVCDVGSIRNHLKKHFLNGNNCWTYGNHVTFSFLVHPENTGYEVKIIKERNGYRGAIQIQGHNEKTCDSLLNDFFAGTEAVRLSDKCPQFGVEYMVWPVRNRFGVR